MKLLRVPTRMSANGSPAQTAIGTCHTTQQTTRVLCFALVAGAAFVLYLASSFVLEARKGTTHFGADTWYYAELAQGNVLAGSSNYYPRQDHTISPATVVMAAAWMQVFSPLARNG